MPHSDSHSLGRREQRLKWAKIHPANTLPQADGLRLRQAEDTHTPVKCAQCRESGAVQSAKCRFHGNRHRSEICPSAGKSQAVHRRRNTRYRQGAGSYRYRSWGSTAQRVEFHLAGTKNRLFRFYLTLFYADGDLHITACRRRNAGSDVRLIDEMRDV